MLRNSPVLSLFIAAVLGLGVSIVPIHLQAASDLEQHLRDQYKGKTLVLRNFYRGASLRYDASGQVTGMAVSGDWTVDAVVQIDDVRVSNHRLSIKAKRQHMGWVGGAGFSPVPSPAGKLGKAYEDTKKLRIEADLSPGETTADIADAAFARIFLTPSDHFVELVPDYWKPCMLVGVAGTNSKQYTACRFSPEFLAIPSVGYAPQGEPEAADAATPSTAIKISGAGRGGVTPPKVMYNRDPEFSEEARLAKYQGTIVLSLVVDKSGSPRNIRIVQPLGCGLDLRAVEAVTLWKFKPSMKDSEPVDVEIAVEVSFHLY